MSLKADFDPAVKEMPSAPPQLARELYDNSEELPMDAALRDLITNLKGGLGLCLFRRLHPESFRVSADQLVLLFVTGIAFSLVSGYLENLPAPEFNSYAISNEGFSVAMLLFSAYVVGRFVLRRPVAMTLAILILSASHCDRLGARSAVFRLQQ